MPSDEMRETARRAARDAIADLCDAVPGWKAISAEVRDGSRDGRPCVRGAIMGADAALAAVYPAIRAEVLREAAGVVSAREALLDRVYTSGRKDERDYNLAREDEAATIRRAILALAQEDQSR